MSWEQIASRNLQTLKLDRVRNKILAFAVLATLLPSVTAAWLSYSQGRRALTETISTELVGVSSQASNDVGQWLRERLYDLRVFTNSYEVSRNVERLPGGGRSSTSARFVAARVGNYLNSVREMTTGFRELVVFDMTGNRVTSSPMQPTLSKLPEGWKARFGASEPILGTSVWDSSAHTTTVTIAVPIQPDGGRAIGGLAAKLDLKGAQLAMGRFAKGHGGTAYLVSHTGDRILSSRATPLRPARGRLDGSALRWMGTESGEVRAYTNPDGVAVIGVLRTVPGSSWSIVTELPVEQGYAQVNRLRNVTIIVLIGIWLVVGLMAYMLAAMLVRPLDRLSAGAAQVAGGDFTVSLPVLTGGELGLLTTVFNDMVGKLRRSMQEVDAANQKLVEQNLQLERLSLTDPLTGLYNRRHLMTMLEGEAKRAARTGGEFAVLMVDVDHFKSYNDAFGHQAGDEALIKVAAVLRTALRGVDGAARYGGEEFLVLLPDTGIEPAAEVAERICEAVRRASFRGEAITLSIGVATFPAQAGGAESVIAAADGALYHAKRQGRDRVVRADWSQAQPAALRA